MLCWWYYFLLQVWSSIWSVATARIGFWTWIWSTRYCGLGQEVACWFQCWKNSAGFFDRPGAVCVKMDTSVLEGKSPFKMLGLTFSSKLDLGSYISLLLKLPRKLEPFVLWSLFLLRLPCSSINISYGHAWNIVVMNTVVVSVLVLLVGT